MNYSKPGGRKPSKGTGWHGGEHGNNLNKLHHTLALTQLEAIVDRIACPGCGYRVRYAAEHAGRRVRCPKCQVDFRIPAKEERLGGSDPAQPEEIAPSPEDSGLAHRRWGRRAVAGTLLILGAVAAALPFIGPSPETPSALEHQQIDHVRRLIDRGHRKMDEAGKIVEREVEVEATITPAWGAREVATYKYAEHYDRHGDKKQEVVTTPTRIIKIGRRPNGQAYREVTLTAPLPLLARPALRWGCLAVGLLLASCGTTLILRRRGAHRGITTAVAAGVVCLLTAAVSTLTPWLALRDYTIHAPGESRPMHLAHPGVRFPGGKVVLATALLDDCF